MSSNIDTLTPEEIAKAYIRPSLTKVEVPRVLEEPVSQHVAFIEEDIYQYLEQRKMLSFFKTFIQYSVNNYNSSIIKYSPSKIKTVMVNMDLDLQYKVREIANKHFGGNISVTIGALTRFGYDRYIAIAKLAIESFIAESKNTPVISSVSTETVIQKVPQSVPEVRMRVKKVAPKRKTTQVGWTVDPEIPSDVNEYNKLDEFYNIERLKNYRELLNLQRQEVALRMGRHRDYVRRIEQTDLSDRRESSLHGRLSMAIIYAEHAQKIGVILDWLNGVPPQRKGKESVQ